jgi:hypothetical protein
MIAAMIRRRFTRSSKGLAERCPRN